MTHQFTVGASCTQRFCCKCSPYHRVDFRGKKDTSATFVCSYCFTLKSDS